MSTQAKKNRRSAKSTRKLQASKVSKSTKQPRANQPEAKKANSQARQLDIIKLILEDHKPLKELIKILKDDEKSIKERRQAFGEFGPLLTVHAKAEEQVLYVFMKEISDMRMDAFEGDVEHGLADQMLEVSKQAHDEDLWSARVKVLAELVEHHIEEEEDEMFPEFKKHSDAEERESLADQYLEQKEKITAQKDELRSGRRQPEFQIRQ